MNKKTRKIVGIIGIILGLIITLYFPVKANMDKSKCTEKVNGKVSNCTDNSGDQKDCDITILFYVNNEPTFYREYGVAYHAEGEEVTVHYNPNDTSQCYVDGITGGSFGKSIFGLIVVVAGAVLLGTSFMKEKSIYYTKDK